MRHLSLTCIQLCRQTLHERYKQQGPVVPLFCVVLYREKGVEVGGVVLWIVFDGGAAQEGRLPVHSSSLPNGLLELRALL